MPPWARSCLSVPSHRCQTTPSPPCCRLLLLTPRSARQGSGLCARARRTMLQPLSAALSLRSGAFKHRDCAGFRAAPQGHSNPEHPGVRSSCSWGTGRKAGAKLATARKTECTGGSSVSTSQGAGLALLVGSGTDPWCLRWGWGPRHGHGDIPRLCSSCFE